MIVVGSRINYQGGKVFLTGGGQISPRRQEHHVSSRRLAPPRSACVRAILKRASFRVRRAEEEEEDVALDFSKKKKVRAPPLRPVSHGRTRCACWHPLSPVDSCVT